MLTGLPKAKKVTTVTKIKKIIPVKLPFIFFPDIEKYFPDSSSLLFKK